MKYSVHVNFTDVVFIGTVEASSLSEAVKKGRLLSSKEHHVATTLNSKSIVKGPRPTINILHIDGWNGGEFEYANIYLNKDTNLGDRLSKTNPMQTWQYAAVILLTASLLAAPFVLYYILSATVGDLY